MLKQVVCEDIEGNKYQVPIDRLSFRPAVYGVIIKEGKVLLSKQWDGYDFPGGGIDLGEPTEEALIREVKEETGLNVTVGRTLHCNSSFFKLPFDGNFVHSIHMYYECFVVGGELSTEFFDEHEKKYASKAEWVDLSRINEIKIYTAAKVSSILGKDL